MHKNVFVAALFILVFGVGTSAVFALPQAVDWNEATYHVVTGDDKTMDTGREVCESIGKTCRGYTAFTTDACKKVHPTATVKSDGSGSKAGFYCNGRPQGGVCAIEENTCHICPTCDINATCDEQIGNLYREMYVECSPQDERESAVTGYVDKKLNGWLKDYYDLPGRWWGSFRSTVAKAFDQYRDILNRLTVRQIKSAKIIVQGPGGDVEVNTPVDSLICEFYQNNKKLVTCGALAAADSFCVKAFDSRFAKAELCQDDGLIVCSKPCTTNPVEVKPKMCAFDNDRPRGKQAAPIDLCTVTKTIKVDTGGLTKKKAGEVCENGGQCGTGICIGQPSADVMKYFCSCKQTSLDTSCGK